MLLGLNELSGQSATLDIWRQPESPTSVHHGGVGDVDGGVPELDSELCRSIVSLGVELALTLSVSAPIISSFVMMQIL